MPHGASRGHFGVLNAIYDTDFLGFSYGFRPGRSPHHALDALSVGIDTKKVNWVRLTPYRGFETTARGGFIRINRNAH
jgi:hypothetical protein